MTMTVTPVLADQLEDPSAGQRLMEFTRNFRIRSAELDARDVEPALVPACEGRWIAMRDPWPSSRPMTGARWRHSPKRRVPAGSS